MKKKLTAVTLASLIVASAISLSAAEVKPQLAIEEPVPVSDVKIMPPQPPKPSTPVTVNTKEEESAMLKKVILAVKEKFRDTDDYDIFSYDTYLNEYGNTTFNLNWSDSKGVLPYMNVSIDADEIVTNYYTDHNYYYDYSYDRKAPILPDMSKDEAMTAAMKYVKTIAPEYYADISADRASIYYSEYNQTYSIDFYRVKNGFGFEYENIYLTIAYDGTLTNYSNSFTKNVNGDIPSKTLPMKVILASFKKNNSLEMKYLTVYDSETGKNKVRLGYVLPYETKLIDAGTGKPYTLQYEEGGTAVPYNDFGIAESPAAEEAGGMMYDKALSPIEQKAVDTHLWLMNADDVKAILVANKHISFDKSYEVTNSNLYTNESSFTDKKTQFISVSFQSTDESGNTQYASAQVNVETEEIVSYYNDNYTITPRSASAEKMRKSLNTHDAAAKKTAAMLKDLYGDKFAEFKENKNDYWTYDDSDSIYLNYTRNVNGIPFENDYLSVTVNKNTGLITSVSITYSDDAVFPSPDKAISASKALDLLTAEFPLTPYYKPFTSKDDKAQIMYSTYNTETDKSVALVYSYSNPAGSMYDVTVDALSGKLTSRWGDSEAVYYPTEYFIPNAVECIKNHPAEKQMSALYDVGILNITNDFNPDAAITLNEYTTMLQNIGSHYRYNVNYTDSADPISAEESLTTLIDTLGYGDIASMNSIFKSIKNIDPEFTGYYAIANAIGLLNNLPATTKEGNLTISGASTIIYNYIIHNAPKG